jgi:DNA invertase Pin-like site-specific DNA recombinase
MQTSKKQVRDMHRMNYPAAEIARALGITRARVYQLLAELKSKPNPAKQTPPTRSR